MRWSHSEFWFAGWGGQGAGREEVQGGRRREPGEAEGGGGDGERRLGRRQRSEKGQGEELQAAGRAAQGLRPCPGAARAGDRQPQPRREGKTLQFHLVPTV